MRALKYAVVEALSSLWRARLSNAFSMVTIAAVLVIFGGFLLLAENLERLIQGWSSTAELSVYLDDEVTEAQRTGVDRLLQDSPIVEAREYVSKAEALARFNREFGDLSDVVADFAENPFPASFEVRLQTDRVGADAIDALAQRLTETGGVADVRYDRRWLERLSVILDLLRGLAAIFGLVLLASAALTVSNVVRLAFHARRDEIEIMRLVGAPAVYIRGPFVAEGFLQGGGGALLALGLLAVAFSWLKQQYGPVVRDVLGLREVAFMSWELALALVAGGMLVGCFGGWVATWGVTAGPRRGPERQPGTA